MVKPNLKTTNFRKHPGYFQHGIHVEGPQAGVMPQYQRAEVIPGADCETVGDFIEELDGSFDVAAVGSGRVGSDSITLTQAVADGDRSVSMLLSNPVDLRWVNYLGFWYRGGALDDLDSGDIEVYIFTGSATLENASDELYVPRADAYLTIDAWPTDFVEKNPAVWRYAELAIADFTVHSANRNAGLKEVWGIGFYSDDGEDGNLIQVDHIEFYTHGTDYGPARGTLLSALIQDGFSPAKGDGLAWEMGSGRVRLSAADERNWAGICVIGGTGTETGKGQYVANVWTPAVAIFVMDGPVHMKCSNATIAVGESVGCAAVGTALTIDDPGGAAEADEFIGKALEVGATDRIIIVLLGVLGIV